MRRPAGLAQEREARTFVSCRLTRLVFSGPGGRCGPGGSGRRAAGALTVAVRLIAEFAAVAGLYSDFLGWGRNDPDLAPYGFLTVIFLNPSFVGKGVQKKNL